jgi:hypothetical protein
VLRTAILLVKEFWQSELTYLHKYVRRLRPVQPPLELESEARKSQLSLQDVVDVGSVWVTSAGQCEES